VRGIPHLRLPDQLEQHLSLEAGHVGGRPAATAAIPTPSHDDLLFDDAWRLIPAPKRRTH
jgi:hypothetical protein